MLSSERVAGTAVVRLEGEIDLANAREVEEGVAAAIGDAYALVLDLTAVSYFDSAGLRMLDGIAAVAAAAALVLRVVAPEGGAPRFVLRICAWRDELLAETVDDALASLPPS